MRPTHHRDLDTRPPKTKAPSQRPVHGETRQTTSGAREKHPEPKRDARPEAKDDRTRQTEGGADQSEGTRPRKGPKSGGLAAGAPPGIGGARRGKSAQDGSPGARKGHGPPGKGRPHQPTGGRGRPKRGGPGPARDPGGRRRNENGGRPRTKRQRRDRTPTNTANLTRIKSDLMSMGLLPMIGSPSLHPPSPDPAPHPPTPIPGSWGACRRKHVENQTKSYQIWSKTRQS